MARPTRATAKRPASPAPDSTPAAKQPRKATGTKAKAEPDSPEPEDKKKPAPKKGKREPKNDAKGDAKVKTEDGGDSPVDSSNEKTKPTPTTDFKEAQLAKSRTTQIPLDEGAPSNFHVFVDPGDQLIYDASLNQTNASGNNNKFYRVQLLEHGNTYKTWTRWGRVGEHGQSAILGNGSLDDALRNFEKKFKDKSGLKWADRGEKPKPNKYVFVERSYEPDSEGEDEEEETKARASRERDDYVPPECKLAPPVRSLMELIFNQQYFEANMASLNYDSAKLPLGKLSKATITRGYEVLKELSDLLDDPSLAASYQTSAASATESLSNLYYSTIPHAFGRNRPPVIQTNEQLKREIELLESLTDLKDADLIMKKEKKTDDIHPLDSRFKSLGLQEMTPLDSKSDEFTGISDYLLKTCGATHSVNYNVVDIFRIQRDGEEERFHKSDFPSKAGSDRRLLWHGSRATNYGGILGQGLRIAPPEAPVSGYMFDKGIYLADMSSKSANYCCSFISGGEALLLLCEAELGDPMQILTGSQSDAATTAAQQGMIATWGQGMTAPKGFKDGAAIHPSLAGVKIPDTAQEPGETNVSGSYLIYNEFICYNVAQVRLRYLLRVRM